jgi:predicted Rdx family selenoprotein
VEILTRTLGVHPEVVKGSGGIFTIAVNGLVVSAKVGGAFPTDEDMVEKVKAALNT